MMRPKRANVCRPMVFDGGFRVREADAETDGKCHRGQARRARQEPDALGMKREIRVFPAQVQAYTKNHQRPYADAGVRRVCGIYGAKRNKSHCLAAGTRNGPVWPPSEELEDLERNWRNDSDVGEAERLSSLERRKRAVLTTSALADTLPTEGFLEAGDLLDCLKKDWRRPAR